MHAGQPPGPPRTLPRDVLKPSPAARRYVGPRLAYAVEELGMMLKTVVEPILLGTKPDEDTGRASVPRDHYLLRLSRP